MQTQEGLDVNEVYTFGLPRVGNLAFSKWFNSVLPQAVHVTHYHDVRRRRAVGRCIWRARRSPCHHRDRVMTFQIVPHLPPESFGYHHVPTEVRCAVVVLCACTVCSIARDPVYLLVAGVVHCRDRSYVHR